MASDGPAPPSPGLGFKKSTIGFLAFTALLAGVAYGLGVSNSGPCTVFLYASGLTLVLASVHRWRDPRKFGYLLLACVVGFFLFVLIHNLSEVGALLGVVGLAVTAVLKNSKEG